MTRKHTLNSPPAHEIFPTPTSTTPYWRTELHPLDTYRSTDELPETSDIVIIGAGMTGVSIAYHLLQEIPPESALSITILEARQVCSGATGRNGGHLKLASWIIEDALDKWGVDAARDLIKSHLAHIMALKNVIEKENIDCDFLVTRSFDVFMDSDEARQRELDIRTYKGMGMDELEHVDVLATRYLEAITGVANSKGSFSVPGAQLWPYKFVTGLLKSFINHSNVNLQTTTQVTSVSDHHDPDGFFHIKTSARGMTLARKVVYATNAYTAGILPMYHETIVPVRGTGAHIVPLRTSKGLTQTLKGRVNTCTYNVFHRHGQVDHLVHRPDGGVVIGGAKTLFINDPEQWRGVVDDGSLILPEQVIPYFERVMTEHYHEWKESGVKVDKMWTGIMGYTTDGAAHVGHVPGRQDQYVCAGFNGAGMVYIFLTARGVARMISGTENFEDSEIPRVFKATKERLQKQKPNLPRMPSGRQLKPKVSPCQGLCFHLPFPFFFISTAAQTRISITKRAGAYFYENPPSIDPKRYPLINISNYTAIKSFVSLANEPSTSNMVILGGLELVAAGYLLKEVARDSKEEEQREHDRHRRRRRRHSRDDHHHSHSHSGGRHDNSPPPGRPGRLSQNSLYPPNAPPRPYSAPPAQNGRPPYPGPPPPGMMWQQHQQQPYPHPQGPPPNHGTWPMPQSQQQQYQQQQQQPQPQYPPWPAKPPQQQQQQQQPSRPQQNTSNFVPPPLQRPATVMLPPPNMHYDMKTGKWQNNMLPPEMLEGRNRDRDRDADLDRVHSHERLRREKTMPPSSSATGTPHINISPPGAHHSTSSLPLGVSELDSETPGRYRPYNNNHGGEKSSYSYSPQRSERRPRAHSGSSATTRYYDEDDMRDPPPAYRE